MTKHKKIYMFVYLQFVLVSLMLPFFSFENYSIILNTTSHLGAQGSPYAWIMNVTFMMLGFSALMRVTTTQVRYHQVLGALFSISLILTGVFRHASLIQSVTSIVWQDQLHSVFATLTGFSFVLLATGHGFMARNKQRIYGFILATIATAISLLMVVFSNYAGLLQRLMLLMAFMWLFFIMVPPTSNQMKST